MTPLKNCRMDLYNPVTQNMKVDMRMNLKTRKVRLLAGGELLHLVRAPWRFTCACSLTPSTTWHACLFLPCAQVELKSTKETSDPSALQKCADFVHAFVLGFEVQDALALLRLDDLYIECFEVKDVKQTLHGEHMSRGIGRMAGKGGKTKFAIENATKTRIVIADTHIRILGSFQNIKIARDSICALIMGSPPGKVFTRLRTVCAHLADK